MNINLIPMSGQGKRFTDAGYNTPKFMLDVAGKPMFVQAANSLPPCDKTVFVVRRDMVANDGIDKTISAHVKDAVIKVEETALRGQLTSCLVARDELALDDSLVIGPCDSGMVYSLRSFQRLAASGIDGMVFTYRNQPIVARAPQHYGFVKTEGGKAIGVSCKVPISKNPAKDNVVVGAFYFKRGTDFLSEADEMVKKGIKVNNEFYVDVLMGEMIKSGFDIRVFEIDKILCWGTPNEYKTYKYWESYFSKKIKWKPNV